MNGICFASLQSWTHRCTISVLWICLHSWNLYNMTTQTINLGLGQSLEIQEPDFGHQHEWNATTPQNLGLGPQNLGLGQTLEIQEPDFGDWPTKTKPKVSIFFGWTDFGHQHEWNARCAQLGTPSPSRCRGLVGLENVSGDVTLSVRCLSKATNHVICGF